MGHAGTMVVLENDTEKSPDLLVKLFKSEVCYLLPIKLPILKQIVEHILRRRTLQEGRQPLGRFFGFGGGDGTFLLTRQKGA